MPAALRRRPGAMVMPTHIIGPIQRGGGPIFAPTPVRIISTPILPIMKVTPPSAGGPMTPRVGLGATPWEQIGPSGFPMVLGQDMSNILGDQGAGLSFSFPTLDATAIDASAASSSSSSDGTGDSSSSSDGGALPIDQVDFSGVPLGLEPTALPDLSSTSSSGTSSGSSSGGTDTNLFGDLTQLAKTGLQSYATVQAINNGQASAYAFPPLNSYHSVNPTGATSPTATTDPSATSSETFFQELTDFSTPYPYIALGGAALLVFGLMKRRKRH